MYKGTLTGSFTILFSGLLCAQSALKVSDTFHIESGGGRNYILADPASNKLYVSQKALVIPGTFQVLVIK